MTVGESSLGPDVAEMVVTIKRYLKKHPQAADTLEGIVNWWLLRQRYEIAVEVVNKALEVLVEQGTLAKTSPRGSKPIYRLKEVQNGTDGKDRTTDL